MTEKEIDAIDAFIKEWNLVEKTGYSQETLQNMVRRAMLTNSFAFILADVTNSILMDCEYYMDKLGTGLSQNTKENFRNMLRNITAARKWSEKAIKPLYQSKSVNSLCYDSDWWLNVIKLIDDRIGTDPQKTHLFIEFLLNMPEGDSPYKVTLNDFKNL